MGYALLPIVILQYGTSRSYGGSLMARPPLRVLLQSRDHKASKIRIIPVQRRRLLRRSPFPANTAKIQDPPGPGARVPLSFTRCVNSLFSTVYCPPSVRPPSLRATKDSPPSYNAAFIQHPLHHAVTLPPLVMRPSPNSITPNSALLGPRFLKTCLKISLPNSVIPRSFTVPQP